MNITIIIAKWPKDFKGSEYTLHFSPNSHERNILFSLDELADPCACTYKVLRKTDLDETFIDHDDSNSEYSFESRLKEIYFMSDAPEKSFAWQVNRHTITTQKYYGQTKRPRGLPNRRT